MNKQVNIKIAGAAGAGVKVTGQILSKSLTRFGFSTFSYREYPSLIRGGHTTYQTFAKSRGEAHSQKKALDILLAFDKQSVDAHQQELKEKSFIIDNQNIPLTKLAKQAGDKIMANSVALGACFALLKIDNLQPLFSTLEDEFSSKGEAVVTANQQAVEKGYKFIEENYPDKQINLALPEEAEQRMVLTGNEACSLAAISAGLKFYCAYPMTPATSILHYLADKAEECDLVVKQPEDEIAAINMAIGASFTGARAMTATSGGGFCLMTEGLGLAGITETPLVIVNSMRTGPASGLPTWSGQGDLRFVIHASQDEFPRFVFAPGDAQETFTLTRKAFQLAEKYQTPVIILLDKNLSESDYSCPPFDTEFENQRYSFTEEKAKDYQRYKLTDNGISPRPFLGEKGYNHLTNSYDHNPKGYATEKSSERIAMMDKRAKKFLEMKKEIPELGVFGKPEAKTGIISWGANKGAILEAMNSLSNVKFLHLNWLWPFPDKQVVDFLSRVEECFVIEGNSHGQLANLIRERTSKQVKKFLKYDGRPFYPQEIIEKLTEE